MDYYDYYTMPDSEYYADTEVGTLVERDGLYEMVVDRDYIEILTKALTEE